MTKDFQALHEIGNLEADILHYIDIYAMGIIEAAWAEDEIEAINLLRSGMASIVDCP